MPTVTRYKPNRSHPRPFKRSDAVRVVCRVLNGPAEGRIGLPSTEDTSAEGVRFPVSSAFNFERDLQAIAAQVRARCMPGDARRPDAQAELSANAAIETLELAEREAEANSGLLANLLDILAAILTFLSLIAAGLRFVPIPAVRLVALGIPRLLSRVQGFQGTVLARKAANDTAWTIYQRTIEALKKAA